MRPFNRIISVIFSIAIVASFGSAPAFALGESGSSKANYWQAVSSNSSFLRAVLGAVVDGVCPSAQSPDGKHHGRVHGFGGNTRQAHAVCDYCGAGFTIADFDAPAAYQEHVEEMPVNGISSEGGYLWYPTVEEDLRRESGKDAFYCKHDSAHTDFHHSMVDLPIVGSDYWNIIYSIYSYGTSFAVSIYNSTTSSGFYLKNYQHGLYLKTPIDGTYSLAYPGDTLSLCQDGTNGFSMYCQFPTSHYSSGDIMEVVGYGGDNGDVYCRPSPKPNATEMRLIFYLPVFRVAPDVSVLVNHEHDYDLETRPGDAIQIDNVTIVDETNNYFTDPGTGETYDMREWNYDYSDRSYHVTTNEGDTYTVTYGDENITIQQGDTVNTYNYYITPEPDPEPEPTPVDPDHMHTYTSETTKAATCTEAGSVKYTCTGCGHTYTESVPALGHDWLVSESTENEYSFPHGVTCPDGADHALTYTLHEDEQKYHVTCSDCGKEFDVDADVRYGHKVYTCSRCGATYEESNKDSGGLFAAIGDLLADGIRWIVDKLKQLVEAFKGIGEIFSGFVERLKESAGGYPEFFGQVIAIMPEDLMNVIWFAIIGVFAVAAWRKWFG